MSDFISGRLQKQCPNCKKIFKQRIVGDRLEYLSSFERRVYCSRECAGIAGRAFNKPEQAEKSA